MGKKIELTDIFNFQVYPEDNSASLTPGPEWNTFVNTVRPDRQKLSALGACIGTMAGVNIHCGMVRICAENFASAVEPPFSPNEYDAFMQGANSQYPLMLDLDRARGGQL